MNIINALAAVDFHVEFPGLGIEGDKALKISKTAFSIGNFSIRWYGIIIALGMLLCFILAMNACKKEGISKDDLVDYLILGIPLGIIGARLYYVIFNFKAYKENFWDVFKIWEGGLAIYGGVIMAVIAVLIMSRIKKHKFLMVLDFALPYIMLGQGIGRWGNFFNQEAYGGYTTLPWGMTNEIIKKEEIILNQMAERNVQGTPVVHPTFFYESVLCLIGFALLLVYRSKLRRSYGECTCLYMIYYGSFRFFIEGLRTDSLYIGNTDIRVSQVVSAAMVVIGIALFIDLRIRYAKGKKAEAAAAEPEAVPETGFAGVVAKTAEMDKEEEEIRTINESKKVTADNLETDEEKEETEKEDK